tara:strand:- start:260 stop:517 length:258 start_codon:yes stop_codon:yes gene_type:complete
MNDKRSKGRPNVTVKWPENQFTAEEIYYSLGGALSRVSVHAKINKALSIGELVCVGKIKPKTGRPKIVYKTATPLASPTENELQQ